MKTRNKNSQNMRKQSKPNKRRNKVKGPKSKLPIGKPCKLTPELIKKFIKYIKQGNYITICCKICNIDYSTYRKWMIRAADEIENGVKLSKYINFFNIVNEAQAEAEASIVEIWRKICPEDWRACRDLLARRFKDRWAPKEEKEIKGDMQLNIEELAALDGKSDDELDEIQRRLHEEVDSCFNSNSKNKK